MMPSKTKIQKNKTFYEKQLELINFLDSIDYFHWKFIKSHIIEVEID